VRSAVRDWAGSRTRSDRGPGACRGSGQRGGGRWARKSRTSWTPCGCGSAAQAFSCLCLRRGSTCAAYLCTLPWFYLGVRPARAAPDVTIRLRQSFYYDEKPMLSNEEFDNLKEELLWEGSKVAVLRCGPAPRGRRGAACRPRAAGCSCGPRSLLRCPLPCRAACRRRCSACSVWLICPATALLCLAICHGLQASAAPQPSHAPRLCGAAKSWAPRRRCLPESIYMIGIESLSCAVQLDRAALCGGPTGVLR